MVSPGNAFSDAGEGYFRIALTDVDRVELAFTRLKEAGISF